MKHDDKIWLAKDEIEEGGKLRSRSFWRRQRWTITAIIAVLVALVFASTTIYLLLNRPSASTIVPGNNRVAATSQATTIATPQAVATDTATPPLVPTVVASPPVQTAPLTSATTQHQFICVTDCDRKLDVVLNNIVINSSNQTMLWNFSITNNGSTCSDMRGGLSLEDPLANALRADGGTFSEDITINAGQLLPRTATFSSLPKHGVQYTVQLTLDCDFTNATYQVELFNY
ncbi:MAG TPA: hypothetical protein VKY19_22090 [Ktedonosporobacter sp.]|jgi:hypothetical protein|nr:hypothetical protein [Ktedonosporobacter sp.]